MTIQEMIEDILYHEGGFVNHPADRGGPTNWGITQAVYSRWVGHPASIHEMQRIPKEAAFEIFELNYYIKPRINLLPDLLCPLVFDCSVNHGPRRAIKLLQSVVNKAGFGPIAIDGALGPNTRGRVKAAYAEMDGYLINALVDERKAFYRAIVKKRPKQKTFLKGWLNRAESFRVKESEVAA